MNTQISERVHIGIFGATNSGKSSLINYLTGSYTSIVADIKGTTTDPVSKNMEITGFGPVTFIDTAGVDDDTNLAKQRIEKTQKSIDKSDIFIYVLSLDDEFKYLEKIKKTNREIIYVAMKQDLAIGKEIIEKYKDLNPISIDISNIENKNKIFTKIKDIYKKDDLSITKTLLNPHDLVILVMPQDEAAPKGRLIKPQVMTIREILDKRAIAISTTLETLKDTLDSLKKAPDLVITDSQVFFEVYNIIPENIRLTSFSILFSAFKGDLNYFLKSVQRLDKPVSNILISEACTHPPVDEDIGTVKIPKMIKKIYPDVKFDFARADDFSNIEKYDLIISCGACMFNRQNMLSRIDLAKEKNIPMTNYGICIAYLKNILDKVVLP